MTQPERSTGSVRTVASAGAVVIVFMGVLLVSLLFGVLPAAAIHYYPDLKAYLPNEVGLWGDSFGFVNAMLSALAFAGVILTLWWQRQELQLQREEMKLTREELAMTREQHERSASAQEESENRLLLAAYLNALESLRRLHEWEMTSESVNYTH